MVAVGLGAMESAGAGAALEMQAKYPGEATPFGWDVAPPVTPCRSGTESAFLSVLFVFNLLSLYQRQIEPEKPYRQPATLRSQVFVAGALLGLVGK